MKKLSRALVLATSAACSATEVSAEIVDKLASVPEIWATNVAVAAALGAIGYISGRSLWWSSLVVAASVTYAWPPSVEPEFLAEALLHFGPNYPAHAQAAQLLPLVAVAVAILLRSFRRGDTRCDA